MASPLRLRARGSATERRGPVTAAQAQLLALDRRTSRPRVCNLSYAVGIDGPLDVAALAAAFAGVVGRHEPLRTTYEGDETVVGEGEGVDLTPRPVQDLEEAAALTAELRRFGREAVVSVFALLVTAFEVLVARWSEVDEPVVGTLAANRPTPQSARILGAHYNPLFLATDLGGDPTLAECVLRVGESTVRALDHQTLPYARLVEELGWDGTRVPAAMLLLDRYPVEELRLAGCRVEGLNLPGPSIPAATTAELSFFVREVGDRLTLSAFSPEGALGDDLVLALAGGYVGILDALTSTPELALAEVDPFGEARLARPDGPGLYELSTVAPAEALSPLGRFDDW